VLDLIECGRGKLNDAAVMSWALRWYEQIQLAAPQYRHIDVQPLRWIAAAFPIDPQARCLLASIAG